MKELILTPCPTKKMIRSYCTKDRLFRYFLGVIKSPYRIYPEDNYYLVIYFGKYKEKEALQLRIKTGLRSLFLEDNETLVCQIDWIKDAKLKFFRTGIIDESQINYYIDECIDQQRKA